MKPTWENTYIIKQNRIQNYTCVKERVVINTFFKNVKKKATKK